ncbi:hypothetical protein BGX24_008664 [Mortierella sp. AD032]|nr:hypothetical protein BGX24_008664 [Mortierella sp. AD032]
MLPIKTTQLTKFSDREGKSLVTPRNNNSNSPSNTQAVPPMRYVEPWAVEKYCSVCYRHCLQDWCPLCHNATALIKPIASTCAEPSVKPKGAKTLMDIELGGQNK